MTDQAPVSSRHVRIKLHSLANVPEQMLETIDITTEITKNDRARTTVQRPKTSRSDLQYRWDYEMKQALLHLEGAVGLLQITMGRTFTIEWDGICRPI